MQFSNISENNSRCIDMPVKSCTSEIFFSLYIDCLMSTQGIFIMDIGNFVSKTIIFGSKGCRPLNLSLFWEPNVAFFAVTRLRAICDSQTTFRIRNSCVYVWLDTSTLLWTVKGLRRGSFSNKQSAPTRVLCKTQLIVQNITFQDSKRKTNCISTIINHF